MVPSRCTSRSSARRPCPQVLQRHPRVVKGASDRLSARRPSPQVPNCHTRGVNKRSADGQQDTVSSGQRMPRQASGHSARGRPGAVRQRPRAVRQRPGNIRPGDGRVLLDNGRVLSDKGMVLDDKQGTRWPGAVRQRNMADWERRRRSGKIFSLFCQDTSSPESGHIPPEQKNTYL